MKRIAYEAIARNVNKISEFISKHYVPINMYTKLWGQSLNSE
jgi:hypothetical protein